MKRIVLAERAYIKGYDMQHDNGPFGYGCKIDLAMISVLKGAGHFHRPCEVQFSDFPKEVFDEMKARIYDKKMVRYRIVLEEISEHDERLERANDFMNERDGQGIAPEELARFAESEIERESK